MATESSEKEAEPGEFPEDLDAWLRQRADDLGLSREELLAQLAGSYRLVVESDDDALAAVGTASVPDPEETVEERVDGIVEGRVDDAIDEQVDDAVEARVDRLDERLTGRVDELEAETEAKLDEVRKRVVQLKDEIDAAADAGHDHAASERVEALAADVERLESAVASLREADTGGDRSGEVADLEEKLRRVASAVVALREADGGADAAGVRRAALSELKRRAGQLGVETADCDACGNEVNLALLAEPACPHCETELRDVTASSGLLFGSATVGSGSEPAGDAS